MWTHSFSKNTQSTRSTTCTRAQKWTPGPCVHTVVTTSVTVYRFVIVAKLMFLMASDREKWSNYVHSCISGTHWLDAATPLQAWTKPMIPRQCWQPLRNKTDRRISCWMVQILLDRITFGVSLSIQWGGGGGGAPDFKWLGWVKDFFLGGGVEIFDSGIFLVSISFTWGFFAYSKQFEIVIFMLLMKQKMLLGVPSVVWVLF